MKSSLFKAEDNAALFLAMPVAWKGTVQQYAGRLHRLYHSKSEVQIYDYVDVHVGVLERMYHKRLKGYAAIGYTAKADSKPFETANAIFDSHNFLMVFNHDISSARSEIVIVSPYIHQKFAVIDQRIVWYGNQFSEFRKLRREHNEIGQSEYCK